MPQQLTSFVSCSFHDEDQKCVVEPLLNLIKNCDIDPRPLNQVPEQGRIIDVVVESIKRHRLFIAIVTKRDTKRVLKGRAHGRRPAEHAFRTAPLIIQEIGIACAFEKQIVVFREKGVDPQDLGLAHGVSEVQFERKTLREQLQTGSKIRDTMERLLRSARQKSLDVSQIIDTHEIAVGGKGRLERTIKVRQLTDVNRWMNEATFHQGVEFLFEQIIEEGNEFRPDVFIGINATGAMIACYLNGRLYGKEARPVGIVATGAFKGPAVQRRTDHMVPYDRIEEHHDVLVVDSQFKRGENSFYVIGEIKERLKQDFDRRNREQGKSPRAGKRQLENVRFSFAALIACGIDLSCRDDAGSTEAPALRNPIGIAELFRRAVNPRYNRRLCKNHRPDFLAFISKGNVKAPKGMT